MRFSKLLKQLLMPFMFHVVETDENGNVIGSGNDKRLEMYNRIADQNDKNRAEEFQEYDEDGNPVNFEVEENPENPENPENKTPTEQPEEEKNEPLLTQPTKKYKIKVNGVDKEFTEEELLERAQKVESADQYLADAARLHREAAKVVPTKPEEPENPQTDDDVVLARAIQMGNEEEAVAAIRKLRSTGPSSDDLAKTIDERLNFQNAVRWFSEEYKDVISDPVLNQLAVSQDNMMRAKGDTRPYMERYKEIGEGIRNWVKSKVPTQTETTTETPETKVNVKTEKENRKAAAPSTPKPASTKAQVPEEEEEEESIQDTIANMAKARGGPQWLRS